MTETKIYETRTSFGIKLDEQVDTILQVFPTIALEYHATPGMRHYQTETANKLGEVIGWPKPWLQCAYVEGKKTIEEILKKQINDEINVDKIKIKELNGILHTTNMAEKSENSLKYMLDIYLSAGYSLKK